MEKDYYPLTQSYIIWQKCHTYAASWALLFVPTGIRRTTTEEFLGIIVISSLYSTMKVKRGIIYKWPLHATSKFAVWERKISYQSQGNNVLLVANILKTNSNA